MLCSIIEREDCSGHFVKQTRRLGLYGRVMKLELIRRHGGELNRVFSTLASLVNFFTSF